MKRLSAVTTIASIVLVLSARLCLGLSISSATQDADGLTCVCDKGVMKVQICKADIVRIAYSPTSTIPARPLKIVTNTWTPATTFTKTESGDIITLQTSRIKVKISKSTANVTYTDLSDNVIVSENDKSATATTVEGISTNTVAATWNSPADEGLFGLGQHQAGDVNYKGKSQVLDEDYGAHATAVSVVVSTKGYGVFWDNYSKTTFSGNVSSNTRWSFSSECGDLVDYYFFYGPEIDQVISGYRTATGKAPLFPKWAYGLIMSRDKYLSQKEFLGVKDGYRNNHIPLDCIVQDWHYWDGAGYQGCYCFNSGFGDEKSTVAQCHQAHLHTMISIWSQLDERSPPYNTFSTNKWVWPINAGCSPDPTHFIDAYSADGRDAFWKLIRDAIFDTTKIGFDAWWLDNDEPFAYPCGFDRHSLTTAMGKGCLFYNSYSFPMSEMGYRNWRKDIPGKRFVMLHRANFAGQQAHAAMQWSNDINCDWPTLKNSVPAGLNSTASGIPYWTTDIGGYWVSGTDFSTAANRELFTRWFQYGSFCSVFRIHGCCNKPKELYADVWDATTKANLLLVDKLHYRLMPYIYTLGWMTTNNDYTPMRMLIFDFRTDPAIKTIGDQFMYGPSIMVSPVTAQGKTSRSVYLPAGKWYDFWTGTAVTGGTTINADAPLSQIPLHVRAGSIIPMGPEIEWATQRSDTIELRVYPGDKGAFTIYEDEGDNYNYETGKHATIPIAYDGDKTVTIGQRSGDFTGMDAKKVFNIVFVSTNHGVGESATASVDKQVLYDGTGPALTVNQGCIVKPITPIQLTLKSFGNVIALPAAISGSAKNIAVYDITGRLLKNGLIKRNVIDLRKDFGLPTGVYVVKAMTVDLNANR